MWYSLLKKSSTEKVEFLVIALNQILTLKNASRKMSGV